MRITLDAYPQKIFTGKVSFVAPSAELVEKIKVFKIEVALDELGDAFRTGMSANVEILGEKRDKAISIPLEALQKRDGKTVAYRLKAEPRARSSSPSAKDGLSGRNKFIWLSDHWKDYFDVVPVAPASRRSSASRSSSGLKSGEQVVARGSDEEARREGRRGQLGVRGWLVPARRRREAARGDRTCRHHPHPA